MDKAITDIALSVHKAVEACVIEQTVDSVYDQIKQRLFEVIDGCKAQLIEKGSLESDIEVFRYSSTRYRVIDGKTALAFEIYMEFSETSVEVVGEPVFYPTLLMDELPIEDEASDTPASS